VGERPGADGDAAHPRFDGLAVDLAARIAGLAAPAQVLMSAAKLRIAAS
jgi:class 3 adenylate cyclase